MNTYELQLEGLGLVKVTKKRGQRSLKIRLSPKGEILVSAPWALPQKIIKDYILSKSDWIIENRIEYSVIFEDGMRFGRNLILKLSTNSARNRSKLTSNTLNIHLADVFNPSNTKQQKFIENKVLTALKHEAEILLLPKLYEIAKFSGHNFNQAYVKNLKSRWGSCDRNKNIILNIYMLQLPEELIEYVMLHELTHTVHLNHSTSFWSHLEKYLPDYKRLRKELKVHQPRIEPRI